MAGLVPGRHVAPSIVDPRKAGAHFGSMFGKSKAGSGAGVAAAAKAAAARRSSGDGADRKGVHDIPGLLSTVGP